MRAPTSAAPVTPNNWLRERGYAITTAMRAILNSAASGDADMSMLEQALAEGLRRGLITRTEVKQAKARENGLNLATGWGLQESWQESSHRFHAKSISHKSYMPTPCIVETDLTLA